MPAEPRGRPWSRQAQVAILLLVGTAVLSSGRELYRAVDLWWLPGHDADQVTPADLRFAPLRRALLGHGVLGYLSERRPDIEERFHRAQYALAPMRLVQSAEAELVVGDFSAPSVATEVLARGGFAVVRDFGDGLLLLRRAP